MDEALALADRVVGVVLDSAVLDWGVVLRHHADLSEREVADTLNISTGTVKSSTSRGLARLRALLVPEGGRHV